MTLQLIDLTPAADDLPTGGAKINDNFTELYGAIRFATGAFDGVQRTDGVISGTGLTSASSAFVAGDVGKIIAIVGAGTSGANHVTTIASVTNGTTIVLTDTAPTAVGSGGRFVYGTDDTAAWQADIDAVSTVGGKIVAKAGISVIAGALLTASSFNAQLKLPIVTGADIGFTIDIIGAGSSPPVAFWPARPSIGGTILFSTRVGSGTRPCVIGASQDSGYTAHSGFTEVKLVLKDLTMRTLPNSGIACVDGTKMANFSTERVQFDTLSSVDQQTAAPTAATHVAFYCSGRGSQCNWSIRDTYITGYYTGLVSGEGGWIDNVFVFSCLCAAVLPVVDYPTNFGNFIVSWSPTGMLWTGAHHCNIDNYLTEHWADIGSGAAWMEQDYDFDDGSNDYWRGRVKFYEVTAGVGRTNNLLVRGCDYAVITSGSSTQVMHPAGSQLTVPNTATFTDMQTFAVEGGGDYDISVEAVISLNAIVGPVLVQGRLYDVTGAAAVPNSLFTVWYAENAGAETRILRTVKNVLFRSPGPDLRQYKVQLSADYISGTSVVFQAGAWVNGGSFVVRRPA